MMRGFLPSMTATQEFVVPRSIPITFPTVVTPSFHFVGSVELTSLSSRPAARCLVWCLPRRRPWREARRLNCHLSVRRRDLCLRRPHAFGPDGHSSCTMHSSPYVAFGFGFALFGVSGAIAIDAVEL